MTFVTRAQWGARPARAQHHRDLSVISQAHVHYADAAAPMLPEGPHDEAADAAAAQVRGIQVFHMDGRGWDDIGYHRLIAPDGAVYEGRPLDQIGAETYGHNTPSVGYCFLTDGPYTAQAVAGFEAQLRTDEGVIGRKLDVRPHSADTATSCPGDALRAYITSRGATAPPAPPSPQPAPAPTPRSTWPGRYLRVASPMIRGDDVRRVQAALNDPGRVGGNGYGLAVDGVYGPRSAGAVRDYQQRHGLNADAVVGPLTWDRLNPA